MIIFLSGFDGFNRLGHRLSHAIRFRHFSPWNGHCLHRINWVCGVLTGLYSLHALNAI